MGIENKQSQAKKDYKAMQKILLTELATIGDQAKQLYILCIVRHPCQFDHNLPRNPDTSPETYPLATLLISLRLKWVKAYLQLAKQPDSEKFGQEFRNLNTLLTAVQDR